VPSWRRRSRSALRSFKSLEISTLPTDVQAPEKPDKTLNLDPKLLQLTLNFETENQPDISAARFDELKKWIDAIKKSSLYPLIQNGLPLHIRGHASSTGTAFYDQDLSSKRSLNVQKRLERMIDGLPKIIPNDRGKDDASPISVKPTERNKAYLQDRNVTIYIDRAEVSAALSR